MATPLSENAVFFLGKIKKALAARGAPLDDTLEAFLRRPLDRDAILAVALGAETQAHLKVFAQALGEALTIDAAQGNRAIAVQDWRTRTEGIRQNPKDHVVSLVVMQWYRDGGEQQLKAIRGGAPSRRWYLIGGVLIALLALLALSFLGR
jgi:hypothetical protein